MGDVVYLDEYRKIRNKGRGYKDLIWSYVQDIKQDRERHLTSMRNLVRVFLPKTNEALVIEGVAGTIEIRDVNGNLYMSSNDIADLSQYMLSYEDAVIRAIIRVSPKTIILRKSDQMPVDVYDSLREVFADRIQIED